MESGWGARNISAQIIGKAIEPKMGKNKMVLASYSNNEQPITNNYLP
jgi:hypothetical protein